MFGLAFSFAFGFAVCFAFGCAFGFVFRFSFALRFALRSALCLVLLLFVWLCVLLCFWRCVLHFIWFSFGFALGFVFCVTVFCCFAFCIIFGFVAQLPSLPRPNSIPPDEGYRLSACWGMGEAPPTLHNFWDGEWGDGAFGGARNRIRQRARASSWANFVSAGCLTPPSRVGVQFLGLILASSTLELSIVKSGKGAGSPETEVQLYSGFLSNRHEIQDGSWRVMSAR